MPKGEHWAKWRAAQPPTFCIECGNIIQWRKARYDRGEGRSADWHRPEKYCSNKCVGMAAHKRQLDKARGRYIDKFGYVILTSRVGEGGYQQPEHRAVMEKLLGRKLEKFETVHHKDGNRQNNHPDNLELWSSRHGRGQRAADVEDIWSGMILPYHHNAL